jgi:uncharacterized protein with von Willebrand factor type A (vWA) domain
MKAFVYSAWDGTQARFRLDGSQALDALSDLLMEGLEAADALEWMRRHGFALAGLDFRVMGIDELLRELADEVRALEERYRMDAALDDAKRRLEEILDREQRALERRHGYESERLNDFLQRRHEPAAGLRERLERLRDHRFEDAAAGQDFAALLDELDGLSDLERFLRERGERFRGREAADYDTAQAVRRRIEELEAAGRALAAGDLEAVTPEQLAEWLGEAAGRSLVLLRDLEPGLRRAGYLRGEDPRLTPRAIRRIGARALADVYASLRKDRPGEHDVDARGAATPRPDATRPFVFGDPLELDVVATLLHAVRRAGRPGLPVELAVDDFVVREMDHASHSTTVLLLDMSWSMSWAGRFAAAKRVALALDHLVRTRFPRDHFFVVGFSTRAREIAIRELPEATWDMGEPFTNLQEGLMLAERLIARHPSRSPQVLVITDGQPTAYFRGRELHVEWPSGFGGVSPHAVAATLQQVRRVTRRGITINTFMLDDAPELMGFVEHMTQVHRGRAFYTEPGQLGAYLMVDYLDGRRKRRGG